MYIMTISAYIKLPVTVSTFTDSMLWTTQLAHPHKAPRSLDGDDLSSSIHDKAAISQIDPSDSFQDLLSQLN